MPKDIIFQNFKPGQGIVVLVDGATKLYSWLSRGNEVIVKSKDKKRFIAGKIVDQKSDGIWHYKVTTAESSEWKSPEDFRYARLK
jgi:hypothetical protein